MSPYVPDRCLPGMIAGAVVPVVAVQLALSAESTLPVSLFMAGIAACGLIGLAIGVMRLQPGAPEPVPAAAV